MTQIEKRKHESRHDVVIEGVGGVYAIVGVSHNASECNQHETQRMKFNRSLQSVNRVSMKP